MTTILGRLVFGLIGLMVVLAVLIVFGRLGELRRPGAYDQVLEKFECRPHNTDPNRYDCRGQMTIWVPPRN